MGTRFFYTPRNAPRTTLTLNYPSAAAWLMSADDHAAAALKLARKKQAGGDDAGAMKMAQKSLRILESDEAK